MPDKDFLPKHPKNLLGTESFRKSEEFLQSPAGQKLEKQRQEAEDRKTFASDLSQSIHANLRKQHADEVARQEEELGLHEKIAEELEKQTAILSAKPTKTLREKIWSGIVVASIVIGIIAGIIGIGQFLL